MADPVGPTFDGHDLTTRLRRIDGQVHGLVRLMDSRRPAVELLAPVDPDGDPCITVRRLIRSA